MKTPGILTLDIDGTLSDASHKIPDAVASYLRDLSDSGWRIVLVTGRTYSFALQAVSALPFPFYLCVQNGADILDFQSNTAIMQSYLPRSVLGALCEIIESIDPLIYAGYERGDACYYRPERFSKEMLGYLKEIEALSAKPWIAIERFADIPQESVPLVKFIGDKETLCAIQSAVAHLPLTSSVITDPINPNYCLLLLTHRDATKGRATAFIKSHLNVGGLHIAAGDDRNDIPMLKEADRAIVMETAPPDMHLYGDIIAAPSSECGIIAAIQKVLAAV